ncbi:MAG: hypothetical protein IBJ03_10650 [Gemmatimonadaceae bacterium]|nr:hypothetical protein [Gemmatimonadaceae bacterium]
MIVDRPLNTVVSSFSWQRARRTLFVLSLALPLAACERTSSLTEPEFEGPAAPKRNVACVQTDSVGNVIAVEPYDGSGSCGDGFDVRIWN